MIIANLLGILTLLYLFWKILKADYHHEKIFNLAFLIIISIFFVSAINFYFPNNFWLWSDLTAATVVFLITIKRQKMKFFETFDAMIISLLPWIGFVYLSDAISKSSLTSFLAFWMTLVCIFIYFFTSSNYRSFIWYKSGRVGFAGVVTAVIYFLIRFVISFFYPNIISMSGKFEVYLSLSAALLFGVLLYNLFRKNDK